MSTLALRWAARGYGAVWELRRRVYARGWRKPERVGSRVVSVGNLTAGGTGKTTLTLHLAARARARNKRSGGGARLPPRPDGCGR